VNIINHDAAGCRFSTDVEGQRAQLDYTLAGGVMTITHTRVPPPIQNRGVAAQLMQAALAAARAEGWSVEPACSYAVAYLRMHPQEPGKQHTDDLLDEALEESFPASDSPSVGGSS
jgi:predicted GNAT family acetyltransferase